jgi:hypothetical protein
MGTSLSEHIKNNRCIGNVTSGYAGVRQPNDIFVWWLFTLENALHINQTIRAFEAYYTATCSGQSA